MMSHLYVAMGTALLVTPHHHRQDRKGATVVTSMCVHAWVSSQVCLLHFRLWLAAGWRRSMCVCVCERPDRLAASCQSVIWWENCLTDASEQRGCSVCSQLCYTAKWESDVKTEWGGGVTDVKHRAKKGRKTKLAVIANFRCKERHTF